ncbi:ATP-dependent RNA helicase eIF4A [Aphelenchoides bicaudatus]|nr:ATP-dependent RNA helicase eIF4A [Aphelenchoides bicaudatus]
MTRMFDVEEHSIKLDFNSLNSTPTEDDEHQNERENGRQSDQQDENVPNFEKSASEKKELNRKKRVGKIRRGLNFDHTADMIQTGAAFKTMQKQDGQTVETNLSEQDAELFRSKYLLKTFDQPDNLCQELQKSVKENFDSDPTVIQQYCIPLILRTKRDIIGLSKTGSGKSAAFILPLIELIQRKKKELPEPDRWRVNTTLPYAIIIEPTRELCMQMYRDIKRLTKGTLVKGVVSFGGIDMKYSYELVRSGADIVVGTPGRLSHLFFGIDDNYHHPPCFDFENLNYIVLDEMDKIIDRAEFSAAVLNFKKKLPDDSRFFLFSATKPEFREEESDFITDPLVVSVGGDEAPARHIVQQFVEWNPNNFDIVDYNKSSVNCRMSKLDYLTFLLERFVEYVDENGRKRIPKTLVFVQTRRASDSVAIWLLRKGFCVSALNSDRPIATRLNAVDNIQNGKLDILVATDVLARGINIPAIQNIINYELPTGAPTNYIHRIGRTARIGNIGRVISFFNPQTDANMSPNLIKWLTASEQEVPDFLENISTEYDESEVQTLVNQAKSRIENYVPAQRTYLDPDTTF